MEIKEFTTEDYGESPHARLQSALRDVVDDAVMEGFSTCLSMVHDHIRDLRKEHDRYEVVVLALDRLHNRIAEDTK